MRRHRARGFTLAEVMAVIMLTSVLAAVALPRLFDRAGFDARAAHDHVASSLRHAQKAAIAMRRNVCVGVGATRLHMVAAAAPGGNAECRLVLANPATGQPFGAADYDGGASVATPVALVFDALGRPRLATVVLDGAGQPVGTPGGTLFSALSITVRAHAPALAIEPETGLVH